MFVCYSINKSLLFWWVCVISVFSVGWLLHSMLIWGKTELCVYVSTNWQVSGLTLRYFQWLSFCFETHFHLTPLYFHYYLFHMLQWDDCLLYSHHMTSKAHVRKKKGYSVVLKIKALHDISAEHSLALHTPESYTWEEKDDRDRHFKDLNYLIIGNVPQLRKAV